MKLQPKVIKLHAKIITPIHIDNWEVLDRMDYFLLDEEWWELQLLNRKWLNFCAKKDPKLFKEIINCIEKWLFLKLEDLKIEFYNNYINKFIEEYWIDDEIKVLEKAKESLLQNNDYSTNANQKWNQWFIKRFSRFWLDKELYIPWSTLKWILRTIFLLDEIKKWENYKKEAFRLEKLDNSDDFKKELFAFLQLDDVNINNLQDSLEIQEINSKNKPPKGWQEAKDWISQVMEVVNWWEFEIKLIDSKWKIDINELKNKIQNYSNVLISREEQILDNISFKNDFINILDWYYKDWYLPIKIWMDKKSLSYKLFWEEMIEELNKNFKWNNWLRESRKKWIWDKMIYIDESENPIWWIAIKILDN